MKNIFDRVLNYLARYDHDKLSGWTVFLMTCMAFALLILMASMSQNENMQYDAIEIATALIIVLFIVANGFFVKQLLIFIVGVNEKVAKALLVACIAAVANIALFTSIYFIYGICSGSTIIRNDVQVSLYFSIVTWTTLGYGDLKPIASLRLVAALEALMGYVYMAILVGLFLNSMKKSN